MAALRTRDWTDSDADGPWPLVGRGDPAPVAWHNPAGRAPAVLLCDHGGNAVPAALNGLGLPAGELHRHIAFDPGAAALTAALAERLDAPAVQATYSRLLVDPNREPDDPTAIPVIADGTIVDGNRGLDATAVEQRLASFFRPYQAAAARVIRRQKERTGRPPAVIALHSFTGQLAGGGWRPWHVGILWHRANPLAQGLIAALKAQGDVTVGDNQPYDARNAHGYTMAVQTDPDELPNALVEVRNDQLGDAAGIAAWGERLAAALSALI